MEAAERHPVVLPIDRIMTASVEVLGRAQAPDVWSTPLELEQSAAAVQDESPPTEDPGFVLAALPEPGPVEIPVEFVAVQPPIQAEIIDRTDAPAQTGSTDEPPPSALPAPSGLPAPQHSRIATSAAPPISFKAVTGKWAAHPAACSERNKRTPYLPLTITERSAKAGGASCLFGKTQQDGNRFSVVATCSNSSERWNTNVRLVLAGNKLTWSSQRGTSTYLRCP